jgi:outer membrane protein
MKKILLISAFAIMAVALSAQGTLTSLQYSMGFGTGNMHDYISAMSPRGFTIDFRKLINDNVGVGIDIGWNTFYEERDEDVYEFEYITYVGKQWRYSNHFPILVAADYYLTKSEKVTPYAGFGLGTMYSLQDTEMGAYYFEGDAWHFAIRPELGFMIKPASNVGLNIVGKYYYGFEAGDLPAQGYFTVNVGVVFTTF